MRQSAIDAPGSWRLTLQQARPGSKEPEQAKAEDGSGKSTSTFSNVLREYGDDSEAAAPGTNGTKAQPNVKGQVENEGNGKAPGEPGSDGQRQGLKSAGLIARTESKLSQLSQLSKQASDATEARSGEKASQGQEAGRRHATHLDGVKGDGQQGDAQSPAPEASVDQSGRLANVSAEANADAIAMPDGAAETSTDAEETPATATVKSEEPTDHGAVERGGFTGARLDGAKTHAAQGERRKAGAAEGSKADPDSSIRQLAAELATSTVPQRDAPVRVETTHAREHHGEGERKSSESLGRTLEHVAADTAHETHEAGESQFDKHINIRVLKQEVHHPVMANPSSILHRIEGQLRDAMRSWGMGATSGAAAAAAADAGTSAQGPLRILQIQLTPAALGNVTVKIGLQDGAVRVQMEAETPQVVHALRHDQSALVSMLRSAGLSVDPASVDVSQAAHGQAHMGTGGEGAAASAQGGGGDARDSGARGEHPRDGRGVDDLEDRAVHHEDDNGHSHQDGLRSSARYI